MCPAFGAVRNLLRMEDAVPIVISSGDGCLYGHTFVAHFYVANRPIRSPGVSSEIWAKGSMFDELRAMVHDIAEKHSPAIIPICSLCVSDTVGLPFDLLPKQVGATEVIYVPLPAYSVHTHARAKDIVVDSLVWRLPPQRKQRSGVNLIGEIFPSDPIVLDGVLRRIGSHVNTTVPGPRWADYVAMVDGALNAPLHPFYSESVKRMKMKQGLPFVEGAPVGIAGTEKWIVDVGAALALDETRVRMVAREEKARVEAAISEYPLDGLTVMVAGYEGHEFLLVRLLLEAGAKVPFLSTAVNANPLAREEEAWLAAHGCTVLYGANFDDEIGALTNHPYDLVIGTTPLCAHAKELGIPSIYYTNAIATRSLMLAEGATAVLQLVTQTHRAKERYDKVARFFADDEDAPARTYTSWAAPAIDLTTHLQANGAL
ncbi:chlorophyllide reductase subunit Y [Vulcanimicrobium alpinum]|uniref:Chlorophyllide reductase subunit Y n=2 Tax=Vulcanimicrobium alpinum TaxID=3016050 RepID=A0AAN1XZX0_UNVUL|nr:chlorophyllide reductase subunit Y [Vulcanimicrobium alpinum]